MRRLARISGGEAERDVGFLRRKYRVKAVDSLAGRIGQSQVLAAFAELEVRVQRTLVRFAVFPGGKDDQVLAGFQSDLGEGPFPGVHAIVGQRPAQQTLIGLRRIVDLDPVTGVTVFVGQVAQVFCTEFGESNLGPER